MNALDCPRDGRNPLASDALYAAPTGASCDRELSGKAELSVRS